MNTHPTSPADRIHTRLRQLDELADTSIHLSRLVRAEADRCAAGPDSAQRLPRLVRSFDLLARGFRQITALETRLERLLASADPRRATRAAAAAPTPEPGLATIATALAAAAPVPDAEDRTIARLHGTVASISRSLGRTGPIHACPA